MADKFQKYATKYGLTPSQAKAIVSIIANEVNCNNCLEFITVSEDEPTSPKEGDGWYNPDDGSFNIYDGDEWQEVGGGGARPSEECCPAENGLTLSGDMYYLGGELTENTLIESYGESFRIIYNPTGTDIWSINLFEPNPGFNMLAAGYSDSASGGTNSKQLLALSSSIGFRASDDDSIHYSAISSQDAQATMTYTDVTGGGINNSSVSVSEGITTLDAPVVFIDSELIQLDGSADIVMETLQNLTITSEDTSGTDSKNITIDTGDNASGNTGTIAIRPGTATNGNGGHINIISGESLTAGIGGNIVIIPATGGTTDGVLIIANLPTFADEAAAAALATNTVYKTATGELRIKL